MISIHVACSEDLSRETSTVSILFQVFRRPSELGPEPVASHTDDEDSERVELDSSESEGRSLPSSSHVSVATEYEHIPSPWADVSHCRECSESRAYELEWSRVALVSSPLLGDGFRHDHGTDQLRVPPISGTMTLDSAGPCRGLNQSSRAPNAYTGCLGLSHIKLLMVWCQCPIGPTVRLPWMFRMVVPHWVGLVKSYLVLQPGLSVAGGLHPSFRFLFNWVL